MPRIALSVLVSLPAAVCAAANTPSVLSVSAKGVFFYLPVRSRSFLRPSRYMRRRCRLSKFRHVFLFLRRLRSRMCHFVLLRRRSGLHICLCRCSRRLFFRRAPLRFRRSRRCHFYRGFRRNDRHTFLYRRLRTDLRIFHFRGSLGRFLILS